jgi:hypothetical protein
LNHFSLNPASSNRVSWNQLQNTAFSGGAGVSVIIGETSRKIVRPPSQAIPAYGVAEPDAADVAWLGNLCQAVAMKKQSADQQFHDRRHQERQRANAVKKKSVPRKEQAQPVATKDLSGSEKH